MKLVVLMAVVVALAGGSLAYLATRPASEARLDDPAGAVVECAAATGMDAGECRAWGVETVASGAPSNTFELSDLGRLRLDRGLFGLASTCRVEWFTTRYADEAAWTDEVPCPAL